MINKVLNSRMHLLLLMKNLKTHQFQRVRNWLKLMKRSRRCSQRMKLRLLKNRKRSMRRRKRLVQTQVFLLLRKLKLSGMLNKQQLRLLKPLRQQLKLRKNLKKSRNKKLKLKHSEKPIYMVKPGFQKCQITFSTLKFSKKEEFQK